MNYEAEGNRILNLPLVIKLYKPENHQEQQVAFLPILGLGPANVAVHFSEHSIPTVNFPVLRVIFGFSGDSRHEEVFLYPYTKKGSYITIDKNRATENVPLEIYCSGHQRLVVHLCRGSLVSP